MRTHNTRVPFIALVGIAAGAIFSINCAAVQANKRVPATIANGVLTPQRPPSKQYGVDPNLPCPSGSVDRAVNDEVTSAKATAKADGRLCAIAEALLGWNSADAPDEGLIRFLAW